MGQFQQVFQPVGIGLLDDLNQAKEFTVFLLAESLVEQSGMEFYVTLLDVKPDSLRYCLQQLDLGV